MKLSLSYLFLLLILLGCQQPTDPEGNLASAIPAEELPIVLADILTLEAAVKELPNTTRDSLAVLYYNQALKSHGYEMDDFQQSMRWLQEDPLRLKLAYEDALEILTVREAELKND